MLVEERRQRVLDLVSERGFVALADLAQTLEVSESTIRRDLDYWDQQRADSSGPTAGRCSSATASRCRPWRSGSARAAGGEAARSPGRRRGASTTATPILLDGGTTTLEVARLLVGRPLQIVTNSLPIANLFANSRETDLVILGGYVYPQDRRRPGAARRCA